MKEKEKKLLTTEQLAEILQVEIRYIYLLCRRGEIPYINIAPKGAKKSMYRFILNEVLNCYLNKSN